MKRGPSVTFLESRQGCESLFTRGLRSGAERAGYSCQLSFVADKDDRPFSVEHVRAQIKSQHPQIICFLMDAPLDFPRLWDDPGLVRIKKVSLWFDDYYRSPRTLANPHVWLNWQKEHQVKVGIWDTHWIKEWNIFTGGSAFHLTLAADPASYSPNAVPAEPIWEKRAVFVGTIPSLKSLNQASLVLTSPLKSLLKDVIETLNREPWPIQAYAVYQRCLNGTSEKLRKAIQTELKTASTLALWNYLVWRWAKRIARLRGLAAVAKAGPVGIFSGHGTEDYAGKEDILASLPCGSDIAYQDTKTLRPGEWSGLFKSGKWQFQIFDPQSISGGLPFRVFEAGACSVPLLSDQRPELAESFPPSTGLVTAIDESELTEKASDLFCQQTDELAKHGHSLHAEFLSKHTWEHRWKQIVESIT